MTKKESEGYLSIILIFFFLVIYSMSPCVAQSNVNYKSQQVTHINWTGMYVAETYEGRSYGDTGICYEIEVRLIRHNNDKYKDEYYGTLSIEGYQTNVHTGITGHADGRHVRVYFDDDRGSFPELYYKNGDIVAEFTYTKDKRLLVQWFGDVRDFVNKKTIFRKKKSFLDPH